eukprot:jgi/Mesvir1/4694/Mv19972-RA.1
MPVCLCACVWAHVSPLVVHSCTSPTRPHCRIDLQIHIPPPPLSLSLSLPPPPPLVTDPRLTDFDTLLDNIDSLKNGKPAQIPIYDFKQSKRVGYRTQEVPASRVVLIEGIYALSDRLRPHLDLQVSITGGVHFDLVKRVLRDLNRSGQEAEEIISQISETVYPMYKAYIEPGLKKAHICIRNNFNPFSGFQNATYILKSKKEVPVEEAIKHLNAAVMQKVEEEKSDIYLLPPGEDPETCQTYIRMRNREGRYSLMFEEWVTDAPFIISPRITFEVSVRILGGLMALGYEIGTIMVRHSEVYYDDKLSIKWDTIEQLGTRFIQIQGKNRQAVAELGTKLGLDGTYIPFSYIEQLQQEKLLTEFSGLNENVRSQFGFDESHPVNVRSWTSDPEEFFNQYRLRRSSESAGASSSSTVRRSATNAELSSPMKGARGPRVWDAATDHDASKLPSHLLKMTKQLDQISNKISQLQQNAASNGDLQAQELQRQLLAQQQQQQQQGGAVSSPFAAPHQQQSYGPVDIDSIHTGGANNITNTTDVESKSRDDAAGGGGVPAASPATPGPRTGSGTPTPSGFTAGLQTPLTDRLWPPAGDNSAPALHDAASTLGGGGGCGGSFSSGGNNGSMNNGIAGGITNGRVIELLERLCAGNEQLRGDVSKLHKLMTKEVTRDSWGTHKGARGGMLAEWTGMLPGLAVGAAVGLMVVYLGARVRQGMSG